jgi:hypothetical protein
MEVFMVDLPAQRQSLFRFLADYNPFYLLSAMCMLFGVFALNDSLDWSPLPIGNLLRMIITLNLYEGMLIALAIVLVNTLVLAAAGVKVTLVFRAAGIPLLDGRFTFVLMQLAVLFAVPGIFGIIAQRHDNYLHPLAIYCGWWLAGVLPVAYALIVGPSDIFRSRHDGRGGGVELIVSRVLLVLPMLSLIAHLCLANWVYKVTFHPLNLSPLLLGLAVAVGRSDQHATTAGWRMRMQLVLPFAAVAFSAIRFPQAMVFTFAGVYVSPLRIALAGATLVYLDGLWMHRHVYFAFGACVWMTLLGMGHSVKTMNANSADLARNSADSLSRLMPRTLMEWGVISIGAAFVLLALGAMLSLLRREPVPAVAQESGPDADEQEIN